MSTAAGLATAANCASRPHPARLQKPRSSRAPATTLIGSARSEGCWPRSKGRNSDQRRLELDGYDPLAGTRPPRCGAECLEQALELPLPCARSDHVRAGSTWNGRTLPVTSALDSRADFSNDGSVSRVLSLRIAFSRSSPRMVIESSAPCHSSERRAGDVGGN
jgi:hypothetical protein